MDKRISPGGFVPTSLPPAPRRGQETLRGGGTRLALDQDGFGGSNQKMKHGEVPSPRQRLTALGVNDALAEFALRHYGRVDQDSRLENVVDLDPYWQKPGHHPADYTTHGSLHVVDVAEKSLEMLGALTEVGAIRPREGDRARFLRSLVLAGAALHDIGMGKDQMSKAARRNHPEYSAQAVMSSEFDATLDALMNSDLGQHVQRTVRPGDGEPREVLREILTLGLLHGAFGDIQDIKDKKAQAAKLREVLTDDKALLQAVDTALKTDLGYEGDEGPDNVRQGKFKWIDNPELRNDFVDAATVVAAADMVRSTGTKLYDSSEAPIRTTFGRDLKSYHFKSLGHGTHRAVLPVGYDPDPNRMAEVLMTGIGVDKGDDGSPALKVELGNASIQPEHMQEAVDAVVKNILRGKYKVIDRVLDDQVRSAFQIRIQASNHDFQDFASRVKDSLCRVLRDIEPKLSDRVHVDHPKPDPARDARRQTKARYLQEKYANGKPLGDVKTWVVQALVEQLQSKARTDPVVDQLDNFVCSEVRGPRLTATQAGHLRKLLSSLEPDRLSEALDGMAHAPRASSRAMPAAVREIRNFMTLQGERDVLEGLLARGGLPTHKMDEAAWQALLGSARKVQLMPGPLLSSGDPSTHVFVMAQGRAKGVDPTGRQEVFAPGHVIGMEGVTMVSPEGAHADVSLKGDLPYDVELQGPGGRVRPVTVYMIPSDIFGREVLPKAHYTPDELRRTVRARLPSSD